MERFINTIGAGIFGKKKNAGRDNEKAWTIPLRSEFVFCRYRFRKNTLNPFGFQEKRVESRCFCADSCRNERKHIKILWI